MRGKRFYSALGFMLAGVVLVLTGSAWAAEAQSIFVERFAQQPGARWTWGPVAGQQALKWSEKGGQPGLWFDATEGWGQAYASWNVGTEAFTLQWDVELVRGNREPWRYPGVYVALASAPPGKMSKNDLALVWAIHAEGVAASCRVGETFGPNKERLHENAGPYVKFMDRDLSPRGVLNAGGAGGHFASIYWPRSNLAGTNLTMRMERDAQGLVTFKLYHATLGPEKPWWQGQFQLPPAYAKVSLQYVVVQTVLNPQEYPQSVEELRKNRNRPAGFIRNLRGRLLSAPAPVEITGFSSPVAALRQGSLLKLQGSAFAPGATVRVGDQPATNVQVLSPTEVQCTLPDLPTGKRHALTVTDAAGWVSELPGGIVYGRVLERIEPFEALPAGGDEVYVVGGGLGKDTLVQFGNQKATVVEVINSGRIKVRVPAGPVGPCKVTAQSDGQAFVGEPVFGYAPHPYLYFQQADLPALRSKFNHPAFANYKTILLRLADRVPTGGGATEKSGKAGMSELTWAYVLTNTPAYQQRLLEAVEAELPSLNYEEFRLMAVGDVAMAYDALFPELTPAQKIRIQGYLLRALDTYRGRLLANDWWHANNPSNTIPVGASGGGGAALALYHSQPTAPDTAKRAAQVCKSQYQAMQADGGCAEGSLYWNYGLTHYLRFAHMLQNTTGKDADLLDTPTLRKNVRFIETQLGGDGTLFTFNDTQPWLTGLAITADLGSRFRQPLMLWMADHLAADLAQGVGAYSENSRGDIVPFAFLWRATEPLPNGDVKAFPGVPTVSHLEVMNWGVLRSSGTYQPGLVVGIKGQGGSLTHHAQADVGSFVLHARGEQLLLDPGYYQESAEDHSLPLFDGKGPSVVRTAKPGRIADAFEAGEVSGMTVDATEAYGKSAQAPRVRRLFVMVGDKAVVVLDDLLPASGSPGQITSLFQGAHVTKLTEDGKAAYVTGKQARLALSFFGPPVKLEVKGPVDFKKSWVFAKLAKEGVFAWHTLSVGYAAAADHPLVTVLQPVGLDQAPTTAKVERQPGRITVRVPAAAAEVVFVQTDKGWTITH